MEPAACAGTAVSSRGILTRLELSAYLTALIVINYVVVIARSAATKQSILKLHITSWSIRIGKDPSITLNKHDSSYLCKVRRYKAYWR